MKDNLFELLLNLFENSLSQLHKGRRSSREDALENEVDDESSAVAEHSLFIRAAHTSSTRILTYAEQMKLTKAGYQFLMKMKLWGVIDHECFEQIMNQLDTSESRIITLQEIKWTIRHILANTLSEEQLPFLDLVLYPVEDKLALH